MKHTITKQIDFCYGHRVWSQKLDPEFSLENSCKCRFRHGHQGIILASLESNSLTDGMVTDFKHLNWFKKWIDDILDHKFILDINDPLSQYEVRDQDFHDDKEKVIWQDCGYGTVNMNNIKTTTPAVIQEVYQGIVFVKFVPTSENLAKWFYEIINLKMQIFLSDNNIKVAGIVLFETPKSQSSYSE